MAVRPLVIAHRGASANVAEHTLAAYELAIEQGADGLECDVRLTADGHLVCVHDRRIDRTSDGWGVVSTKTLGDLQRYDFGSWIADEARPRRKPLRERRVAARRAGTWPEESLIRDGSGAILTLPTLLELVTSGPRPVRLAVETKHPTRYAGWVEEQLVGQLRRFGLAAPPRSDVPRVALMSFSSQAVRRFRELAPGLPRVFLMDRVPLRMRGGLLPYGARIAGVDVAILRAHPEYVGRVQASGSQVYAWTVDDPFDVELCRRLEVAAIITNRPAAVHEVLARRPAP
ncbi:MAG TPA: glycerophosphodiester phosphodiesterase family protein [Candidatus Nanopelagicales bacterium]